MRSSRRNSRRFQSRSENLSRPLPPTDAPIALAAPVLAPPSAASLLSTARPDAALREIALRDIALRGTFSVLVAGSVLASGLLAGSLTTRLAHADEALAVAAAPTPDVTPVAFDASLMTPSIDQNGPVVSILQPSYNDVLRGRNATILIEVKAARNPVNAVEIFVDGISHTKGPVALSSQPSTGFNFDTTVLADGRHRLTVKVTDSQGFIGQSEVWIYLNNGLRTDTAPPSLRWLNMSSGQVLRDRFSFQLQAEDSDFGVKHVLVSIHSALPPNAPVHGFFSNRPPYVFDFDTRTLPDGLYILSARAADSLENEGKVQSITFGIANNTLNPTWIPALEAARAAEQTGNTVAVAANSTAKSPVATAAGGARQSGVRTATNPTAPATQRVNPVAPSPNAMTVARGPARIGAATRPATPTRPSTGGASVSPAAPLLARELFRPRSIPGAAAASRPAPNFSIAPMVPSSISGARKPETIHSNPLRNGLPPAALRGGARSASSGMGGSKNGLTPVPTTGGLRVLEPGAPSAGRATVAAPQAPVGLRRTEPMVAALPRTPAQRRLSGAAITVSPVGLAAASQPEYHVARTGETLSAIAARYKMPPAVLAAANNLKPAARPIAGTRLLLPREIAVKYAGKPVTGDVAAIMVGSTSITPFRFLFEQQGGTMTWDGAQQRVVARNEKQEITLTIGSRAAMVNREEVMMDLAAFLLSGRTMVPIRFFEKALHAQVEWEPSSGRLYVTMAGSPSPG